MSRIKLALMVILFNVLACQHFGKSKSTSNSVKNNLSSKKAATLDRRFPKTKVGFANNSVLSSASSQELRSKKTSDGASMSGSIELTEKEKLFFELVGEKIDNLSEVAIYQRVVEKYQKNDDVALLAYVNLLLKKYPRSIYCDNALYLEGMMYFSAKKFGESLASFQKVLNLYPQSNKAVSALFAKGIVFKKMNLNKQALQLLAEVINRYPGSPESARAEVEVKLITQL